jgi:hypothetical protein
MRGKTEKELQEMFQDLNKRLFKGKLPDYKIWIGGRSVVGNLSGFCDNERRTISLAPEVLSNEERLHEILLHEMCHIGKCDGHGKLFVLKLQKLLSQGETWAKEEMDRLEQFSYNDQTRNLGNELDDCALDCFSEKTRFPPSNKVFTTFAYNYGYSRRKFLRTYPWVRTRWMRAKNEAKSLYTAREEGLKKLDHLRKTRRRGR